MDNENKFWVRIFGMIITGVVLIALSISGCTVHQNGKISEAIKNGVPAERARIAFSSQVSEMEKAVALLTAVMKKENKK